MDMIIFDETNTRNRARTIQERKRQQRRKRLQKLICLTVFLTVLLIGAAGLTVWLAGKTAAGNREMNDFLARQTAGSITVDGETAGTYPQELLDMLEKNEEAYDYVKDYPDRQEYIGGEILLDQDYTAGQVPLLMQWDKRWGYDLYGDTMIGIGGCGPTCLSMAYIYLTGDTAMNPRAAAEYACDSGYYTTEGTSWSLWSSGVQGLGLTGTEISLSESILKKHLDAGELIVCSMAPGDFTTTGHFIIIRDYDESGFFVNDPNRKSNSEKQWTFERLSRQIKCLWAIGK